MLGPVPKRFFLTTGAGNASTDLNAFDAALIEAGLGDTNLVRLSSILPPGSQEIPPSEFPKGCFVPLAYGDLTCSEPGTIISAAIAVGIPDDPHAAGLIMECARIGRPGPCEDAAGEMVREGMEHMRGLTIREIKVVSTSLAVERVGAVFAAVVLCP